MSWTILALAELRAARAACRAPRRPRCLPRARWRRVVRRWRAA